MNYSQTPIIPTRESQLSPLAALPFQRQSAQNGEKLKLKHLRNADSQQSGQMHIFSDERHYKPKTGTVP
jgi:hypothetical protein